MKSWILYAPLVIFGVVVVIVGIFAVVSINTAATTTQLQISTTTTSTVSPIDEVKLHASRNDCWIVVSGNVYDVTSYIPLHPGGANRIVKVCGGEATNTFETQGGGGRHSSFAHSLLQNYLIGSAGSDVTQNDLDTVPANPPNANDDDDENEEEDDD